METSRSSWIWQEARKIDEKTKDKKIVVFETGYGPSGLPHIGTFQEVARTTMVKKAFEKLTGKKIKLIVFSDDLDALRKVPSNVPNPELIKDFIGTSLTSVPNPFGTDHKSYAEHNNAKLQEFLNAFAFEYEFMSSKLCYQKGIFNEILKLIGKHAKEVKEIVTKGYGIKGGNRKETYCPFIPIDPITQRQTFNLEPDWYVKDNVLYYRPFGEKEEKSVSILDGNVKCQWKVDWALRWMAFGVDYEMHGKDLIDSAKIGLELCRLLKQSEPITFMYEMYLDEKGAKISKSKGNGIEFQDWVNYAPQESLQWFLFQNPRKARKLFWGMIPQTVDSLIRELENEPSEDNACWAIYQDNRPNPPAVTYQMLLNLVNIANTDSPDIIWKYILNYQPGITPEKEPFLQKMVEGAIRYYKDKIAPFKEYRIATADEQKILIDLAEALENGHKEAGKDKVGKDLAEFLMNYVYEVGKKYFGNDKDKLRENYFKMLYQVLMGQDTGPRFGHFAVAYGIDATVKLLRDKAQYLTQ